MVEMYRKIKRLFVSFIFIFALALSLCPSALAYTVIDTARVGSVTVSPQSGRSIGSRLTIYKVADVVVDDADQKYVLTEDFAASGVELGALDDADTLAVTLAAYADSAKPSGTTKDVGDSGSVTFDNLALGLYLVIQEVVRPGGDIINPFLVSVPLLNADGTAWIYNVDASPKAETYELTDITVKKVWNDGGSASSRPASISVSLYLGGALLDTVELNSTNGWSYTWKHMSKSDSYSVVEAANGSYAASYSQSGYTFTVTNTPKLAQTGQLNWPVPVLACGGLLLFALGWGLVFLKKENDSEKQ